MRARFGFLMELAFQSLAVLLAGAAPALAAPLDALPLGRESLLVLSFVLLSAALIARLVQRRRRNHSEPDGPDMRWWRNP